MNYLYSTYLINIKTIAITGNHGIDVTTKGTKELPFFRCSLQFLSYSLFLSFVCTW